MEASGGLVRGNVTSLVKVVLALEDMGIEIIGDRSVSSLGGRGVLLRERELRVSSNCELASSWAGSPTRI